MMIRTNAASYRKEMVKALTELLGHEPRYCKAPTFAYEFNVGTLDREATLHLLPSLNAGAAEQLAKHLEARGFICKIEEEAAGSEIEQGVKTQSEVNEILAERLTIHIDRERMPEETLAKVKAIVAGKASLLGKAFGVEELSIIELPTGYAFPWFEIESSDEERAAYTSLIDRMIEFAATLRRVTAKDKEVDNAKYAMRCFLLRLGFIGDEYKKARAILLRNLDGNSAFRSGAAPKRRVKEELPQELANQSEEQPV